MCVCVCVCVCVRACSSSRRDVGCLHYADPEGGSINNPSACAALACSEVESFFVTTACENRTTGGQTPELAGLA